MPRAIALRLGRHAKPCKPGTLSAAIPRMTAEMRRSWLRSRADGDCSGNVMERPRRRLSTAVSLPVLGITQEEASSIADLGPRV